MMIFAAGFENLKLYFMIGLPTEEDDDVRGIVDHRGPGNGTLNWAYVAAHLPPDAIRVLEIDQHEPDERDARGRQPGEDDPALGIGQRQRADDASLGRAWSRWQ